MSGQIPSEWPMNGHGQDDYHIEGAEMAAAPEEIETSEEQSRRAFLAKCGKFAIVTPPAVTLLLHTSMASASGAYGSPHGKKKNRRRRKKKHHHHHRYYGGDKRKGKRDDW